VLHLVAADIAGAGWTNTRLKPSISSLCSSGSTSHSTSAVAVHLRVLHQPTANKRHHHPDQPVTQAAVAWICAQDHRFCCRDLMYRKKNPKQNIFPALNCLLFQFKSTWSSLQVSELKHSYVSLTHLFYPVIILQINEPNVLPGSCLTPGCTAVSSPVCLCLRQAPGESSECAASAGHKAEQSETGAAAGGDAAPARPAPSSVRPALRCCCPCRPPLPARPAATRTCPWRAQRRG